MLKYILAIGFLYLCMSVLSKTWDAFRWSEGSAEMFFAFGVAIIGGFAVWDILENKQG
jgi:hypothetical protein